MFYGTAWSLLPPIIAIVLALVTKEVYLSLFCGVAVGAFMVAGPHPWQAFTTLFSTMTDSMDLNIIIFDVLLGMIIVLMSKCGGTAAYGRWASGHLKSKKSALAATAGLHHRRDGGTGLHHCSNFQLGCRGEFLCTGGRKDEWLPAFPFHNSVQSLRTSDFVYGLFYDLPGERLRFDGKA